jgi:hypothetical protein
MGTYPPPGPGAGGVGRRIEEAIELIEMDVNDAVIPQVRIESIDAMRKAADALRKFADRLDNRPPRQSNQPPPANPTPSQGPRS